jgi:hypothetical protein
VQIEAKKATAQTELDHAMAERISVEKRKAEEEDEGVLVTVLSTIFEAGKAEGRVENRRKMGCAHIVECRFSGSLNLRGKSVHLLMRSLPLMLRGSSIIAGIVRIFRLMDQLLESCRRRGFLCL